jgi:hypothetical protein
MLGLVTFLGSRVGLFSRYAERALPPRLQAPKSTR